jgi:hypothetical protein
MSAPTTSRPDLLTARSNWPIPVEQARVWMENPLADPELKLHRIEHWTRAGDGWMYARCGHRARVWVEPNPRDTAGRDRCLGCEDTGDLT